MKGMLKDRFVPQKIFVRYDLRNKEIVPMLSEEKRLKTQISSTIK
jgi:hypothetical protein